MEKDLSRKENIMRVTLDIIMKEGFEGVTIRKIATLAKVNVALINYHFGSKENLINESLKILTANFKASFAILDDETMLPKEKLKAFLIKYVGTGARYPYVVKQIFVNGTLSFQSQNDFFKFLKDSGFEKIRHIISQITGETNPSVLMTMMVQMMGSMIFPILVFPDIKGFIGITPNLADNLEEYVNLLVDNYFSKYK